MTQALEVSVGKAAVIYAQNGTDVLLPCTFTTCIGFDNAKFSWTRNGTEVRAWLLPSGLAGVGRTIRVFWSFYCRPRFSAKHAGCNWEGLAPGMQQLSWSKPFNS